MIRGWTHRAFPIDDASRVGEARRHAATLAVAAGWSDVDAGRLALVVTELGTNLHRHAVRGRLLIAARPAQCDIEVLSIDEGPGIADPLRSLRDGYSTAGTPGTGLGAVRRLSDEFDLHSAMPDGTVCVARVRTKRDTKPETAGDAIAASTDFALGAVCLPAPGEVVCGDGWAARLDGRRASVVLADGLGHGPEAAKASVAALDTFAADPFVDLAQGVRATHTALQTTRGAALLLLRLDTTGAGPDKVTYAGAGNVVGRVVSGLVDKSVITQHGTAGLSIRRTETTTLELPPHALVVLHSDGIDTRWKPDRILPVMRSDPALVAAVLLRDHTRQRDDATIVVLKRIP